MIEENKENPWRPTAYIMPGSKGCSYAQVAQDDEWSFWYWYAICGDTRASGEKPTMTAAMKAAQSALEKIIEITWDEEDGQKDG